MVMGETLERWRRRERDGRDGSLNWGRGRERGRRGGGCDRRRRVG